MTLIVHSGDRQVSPPRSTKMEFSSKRKIDFLTHHSIPISQITRPKSTTDELPWPRPCNLDTLFAHKWHFQPVFIEVFQSDRMHAPRVWGIRLGPWIGSRCLVEQSGLGTIESGWITSTRNFLPGFEKPTHPYQTHFTFVVTANQATCNQPSRHVAQNTLNLTHTHSEAFELRFMNSM